MTEAEWLESISVPAMLRFLQSLGKEQKLPNFIRASFARVWPDLANRWDDHSKAFVSSDPRRGNTPTLADVAESVHVITLQRQTGGVIHSRVYDAARHAQADLLREIVGNPFRTPTVDPHWLVWSDGTIAKMARSIREERAFDRLPILADALEDAGCTDRDILDHCRGPNQHVPGCWVLELLLVVD